MSGECDTHGAREVAMVCRHLRENEQRGFHYDAERDSGEVLCPTAWCDDCHESLVSAGEWNEQIVKAADFRAVCVRCYALIRSRNWSHDDQAFARLLDSAVPFLESQQEVLYRDFQLSMHQPWDWDQDRSQLTFSDEGRVVVVCDIALVGSFSSTENTWMWSWASDSLAEQVKAPLRELCEFGEERGFEKLAGAYWDGTETDGWQMTAIAAKYLGAIGAHRAPDERGFIYMVITRARWAP
jgi:hypothetical protein